MDDTLDDIHMHRSEDSHDMDDIHMQMSKDSHEGPKRRKLRIEDLRKACELLPPRVFAKVGTSEFTQGHPDFTHAFARIFRKNMSLLHPL